ncbi:MAG: hypothetical protein AAB538_00645 [Patescibacteria group bacterium]
MKRAMELTAVILPLAVLAAALLAWLGALASKNTPRNFLSTLFPWPVVCTTRGCITTHDWGKQLAVSTKFSEVLKEDAPTVEQGLTSAVRRHLVTHSSLPDVATASDARRYREEVLHLKDEKLIQETAGLSLAEYDEEVILPFLQQAALQQQRNAESLEELYRTLSEERAVVVLLFHYRWDKDTGTVAAR